jgi:hypothetical protein
MRVLHLRKKLNLVVVIDPLYLPQTPRRAATAEMSGCFSLCASLCRGGLA